MARSESSLRIGIEPEVAFDMWADLGRLADFLPGVVEAKEIEPRVYSLLLAVGETREGSTVEIEASERPRRVCWRTRRGAKWNGEVVMRPVTEGTEVRLTIDFEPHALLVHPEGRTPVVPMWDAAASLLAFSHYVEDAGDGETVEPQRRTA